MKNSLLSLINVNKYFDNSHILKDVSFDIKEEEFLTLLGPSGCGKTTILRCIGGLETIDSGDILLNGISIKDLPANKRNINTIFQNYALFPHLNIYDNIAYGPRIKKSMDEKELKERISEFLELVEMTGYEDRMISQLSGGQNQRIAIARALINQPDILLLDEPLGALDLKLRKHMQTELTDLQKQTKTTFVYVTHDQEEAVSISDRIIVINKGEIQQIGSSAEVYNDPKNLFVADFIGDRNIKKVKVLEEDNGYYKIQLGDNVVSVRGSNNADAHPKASEMGILAILMDKMKISTKEVPNAFLGKVLSIQQAGSQIRTKLCVDVDIFTVIEYRDYDCDYKPGDQVYISWEDSGAVLLPDEVDSEKSGVYI